MTDDGIFDIEEARKKKAAKKIERGLKCLLMGEHLAAEAITELCEDDEYAAQMVVFAARRHFQRKFKDSLSDSETEESE